MKVERWQLQQRQAMPLELKIRFTESRIRQALEHWHGEAYVAFSGGLDSTVLLDITRKIKPGILAVFCNTGLEFPEIMDFVKSTDNVHQLRPALSFKETINQHGYPVVSKEVSQKLYEIRTTKSIKLWHKRMFGADNKYKSGRLPIKWRFLISAPFKISHKCCDIMKKRPSKKFEKESGLKPFLGTMAADSHARRQKYMRSGCNSFQGREESAPLAIWTNKDIHDYVDLHNLPYSKIYDMGYNSTGCIYCPFGCHLEKGLNKFQKMKETHPSQYNYCMNKIPMKPVLDYAGIATE